MKNETKEETIARLSKKHTVSLEFIKMFFEQNKEDVAKTEKAIVKFKSQCTSY